ncbi:PTS mannose/fructose/sorbose/N-acetylgalactosamine transporter subunit IIC [Megamonas funiformis]|jgi:PTS system mannose-specific IIC component|uniref:PTS mannose/fructose/sorbose/N-acetylgalactosamine transporter subunit IIC n=1 Tax=Megamonas funiformis TaxID=437897 RepID=UPI00241CC288|nr:PTS sugar transporter subunit IIC [Megamonas funiformis]
MEISWLQAIILGIFACLASMPGMGGTVIGNYTLGRPLVGGLVCGIILGDIQSGILIGTAMQVVYIALVTPGGMVSADVRAVSYIGIPLAMIAVKSMGIDAGSPEGMALATSFGSMVGTLGTVLFYGTATINLAWQHIGWKAVERGEFHKLYMVDMGLPWISHIICSFLPTLIMCKMGAPMVELIKVYLPMDGLAMQTLFTVGALLPAVGVAILLKQVADSFLDFIPFFLGFALAAGMGLNLIGAAIVGGMFAIINYKIQMLRIEAKKAATAVPAKSSSVDDDDDEDI